MDENAEGGTSHGGGDDKSPTEHPWKQFDAAGQLKKDIEEAWDQLVDKSCPYEVVITVVGNNPLSGYFVTLKPGPQGG